MATPANGQSSAAMDDQTPIPAILINPSSSDPTHVLDYSTLLEPQNFNSTNSNSKNLPLISFRPINLLHSDPYIKWTNAGVGLSWIS